MRQTKRTGQLRRRLMAGLFCISLFVADLMPVIPASAQETVAETLDGRDASQGSAEIHTGEEAQSPNEDKEGNLAQNPEEGDEGNKGNAAQNPEDGKEGNGSQNPDEGKEDIPQEPGDGNDAPEQGGENGKEESENPDQEKDGDEAEEPDGKEETEDTDASDEKEEGEDENGTEEPGGAADDAAEAPADSDEEDTTQEEEPDAVSENDLEEETSVRALAVPADAIASGAYENITWVIDADGKLTVEGTGEFAEAGGSTAYGRAPWGKNFNTRSSIKSAEVRVSGMKDASWMFYDCYKLTKVSFAGSDMGSLTNMARMFSDCSKLESIDWGQNFSTKDVTDMSYMFRWCPYLKDLDMSRFDTTNVTDMSGLFQGCFSLGDIDLSRWNTEKVTNMGYMFDECWFNKITLGGSFTTRNVTNMGYMFACRDVNYSADLNALVEKVRENRLKLNGLDLAWLDLSSVQAYREGWVAEGLGYIFADCNIKQLDLSRLDTGRTTNLAGLFAGCELTGMDFSDLRTDTITDMTGMFTGCKGSADLRTLHTDNVTDMTGMLSGSGLTSIHLEGLNTEHVTSMNNMFGGQEKLKALDVSALDTRNVTDMNAMFNRCAGLESIDLRGLDMGKVTDMGMMFHECKSLKEVHLGNLGSAQLEMLDDDPEEDEIYTTPVYGMFWDCTSLKSIDLSRFDFGRLTHANSFFANCDSLTTIRTPSNVAFDYPLPQGTWYMADGTTTTMFPKNLPYSVLLQKGKKPAVSAARMEASKKKTTYACGETVNTDDLTVMYYGTDGSARKLTADEYTTNAAELNTSEPGTAELVVTYTKDGNTLTAKLTLTISHILTADNTVITIPGEGAYDYTYDGQPKTPEPLTVSYTIKTADGAPSTVTLTGGKDYTVSYKNNTDACELPVAGSMTKSPTVTIKGAGSYSGTVTKTFAIHKAEAPAAETLDIMASQCAQAKPGRTADLAGSFRRFGKKTGYEILSVEDTKKIFAKTPVTADIKGGVLTYSTNAALENDTATLRIKVSFANYKDAELTVKITMVSKKAALISGVIMQETFVYSGAPVSYGGEAAVRAEDGADLTGKVALVYRYSGVMADGTPYPESGGKTAQEAPVNAGDYVLTVSVKEDDPDYAGKITYPFTIKKAAASVKAKDIVVLMQTAQEEDAALVPVEQYKDSFGCEVTGLRGADTLRNEPAYTVTEDEGGTKPVTAVDTSKAGAYYIHPSGADAGMNYQITYKAGTLVVAEERVAYTVTFDGMGRCDGFTKRGIKAGALLELSDSEQTPEPKEQGYVFAGWYRDKSFAAKSRWSFDADTVQSDLTLYGCWLSAPAENGEGLKLCVQEIPDLTYTGSAQKPAVTVYDSDGKTALKAGKDYTIKYVRNTDAVAVGADGKPAVAGGTARVINPGKANEQITDVIGHFTKECPYVVITGKGNYAETVYRNFRILPTQISAMDTDGQTSQPGLAGDADNTPLAAGFTMKYTDQFESKAGKTAKIVSSVKYKKALKADKDYTVSVADEAGQDIALTQGKLPLNAGIYTLTVTGRGNYAGTVRRKLYVAEKQKLMKNASVTYKKKIQADGADALAKGIEQKDITVKISGNEIAPDSYAVSYGGTNRAVGTATMTLIGKNGYVGTKSVTFQITGAVFSAGTVEVKAYNAEHPNEDDWKASMPYTGKAVTQNKVTLTTKATRNNPETKELTYGRDYTITYKNNVKKGTASMTFTAKAESGYSGSFKKTFKITAQELVKERVKVEAAAQNGVPYSKNGAKLPFIITNEEGKTLREGTDYTVKYKNNKGITTAQMAENKKPLVTIAGKGNYTGKVEVPFTVNQVSLADAIDSGTVSVTCAQVQNKNSMKWKDFKCKLVEGKKTLGMSETKDYIVDETKCTPEIIKAYAEAAAAGTTLPQEPEVTVKGRGCYTGEKTIRLGKYIYADKLAAAKLYVAAAEGPGQNTYTGSQVTPDVAVYYGEKAAVAAAKRDKVKDEETLTAETGKYKLKKLEEGDYTLSYGANIAAGANKGSVTITGAGRYGGSVTVKFTILKKAIW